ncbi:MAG: ABC transporter ATP-binding protein [Pseudomonadota bacterium]
MDTPTPATSAGKSKTGCAAPWLDADARPHLKLIGLRKTFGDAVAINDISLDIYAQEFFALLGPSGCGKTTLLRMLAGFETPDEGRIELDGQDIADVPPYERPVNMMFQSYALFPHMSVAKNIAFGLEQEGMAKSAVKDRVDEMLSLVKLEPMAHRRPHQLSGGQRQRVALARALAKRPKLLLLDEPLGALDKKLREETQFELVNIQEELGLTFVIVTHDQEEAMTVSTRLAVMDHGRLAQVGEPHEVYEAPSTRYVADFLGDVNFFEGVIADVGEDGAVIASEESSTPFRASRAQQGAPGGSVTLALRPEKLRIERADTPEAPTENMLEGVVEDIAYLGDMSIYRVRLSSDRIIKVARTNRVRTLTETITWEDKVRMSWDAGAVVVLAD